MSHHPSTAQPTPIGAGDPWFSALGRRLGYPGTAGRGRTVAAVAIDAVGTGVFLPISLLYFVATTNLSLVAAGAALTTAAAAALPLGPVLGGLVDRWGARPILLGGNALQAVSFGAYLFSDSFAAVTFWVAMNTVGRTGFWGAFTVVIAEFSADDARERWFGFFGALRNLGYAVGGLLAGAALTIGTPAAFQAVALVNVVTFATAFLLLVRAPELPATVATTPTVASTTLPGSWRTVLLDRPYLLLVVLQVLYSTAMTVLVFGAPVYITLSLGLPGWVAGAMFTISALMVGLLQGFAVEVLAGTVRWRALALAHLIFAAGYLLFLLAAPASGTLAITLVLVGAVLFTVGELLGTPVQTALSVDAAPPPLLGRYTSLVQLAQHTVFSFAPLVFAGLLASGTTSLWVVLIAVAVAAAALCGLLASRMPAARARVAVPRDPAGRTAGASPT